MEFETYAFTPRTQETAVTRASDGADLGAVVPGTGSHDGVWFARPGGVSPDRYLPTQHPDPETAALCLDALERVSTAEYMPGQTVAYYADGRLAQATVQRRGGRLLYVEEDPGLITVRAVAWVVFLEAQREGGLPPVVA